MQEQKTNLEKIINSSIDEIRQKMLTICKDGNKNDLDFQSAVVFIGQIKEVVSDFGCHVVKSYFESRDEPDDHIESGGKRYLNKGKSTKEIITSLGKIGITRSYYQHRSGGNSLFPLDEKLGVNGELLLLSFTNGSFNKCSGERSLNKAMSLLSSLLFWFRSGFSYSLMSKQVNSISCFISAIKGSAISV